MVQIGEIKMLKYLAIICIFLVIIPFFGPEPLYPISISFLSAILGTIFGLLSMKKETGILGKIAFIINALLVLLGVMIILFSIIWILGAGS